MDKPSSPITHVSDIIIIDDIIIIGIMLMDKPSSPITHKRHDSYTAICDQHDNDDEQAIRHEDRDIIIIIETSSSLRHLCLDDVSDVSVSSLRHQRHHH